MEGSGAEREETRQLLVDVLETYLPLSGRDAEEYEELLQRPENQGIRQTMKTWLEQHEEAAEACGARRKAQEAVLRVMETRFGPVPEAIAARVRRIEDEAALDALLDRALKAASLAETGLA